MVKIKIALLGIDGSGKSTVSKELKNWLENKGYKVKIIPFHKWVFADKLRTKFSKIVDKDRKGRDTPYSPKRRSLAAFIKPPLAFIDNILFYLRNSPKKGQVYIYDRFVCATQIKFKALNYQVNWFKFLWWNIKPDIAFIFDVNEEESIKRQTGRNDSHVYNKKQLKIERDLYKKYAAGHRFPIIRNRDKKSTIDEIKKILIGRFEL